MGEKERERKEERFGKRERVRAKVTTMKKRNMSSGWKRKGMKEKGDRREWEQERDDNEKTGDNKREMESGLKTWIEIRRKRERGKERDGGIEGERAKYIAYLVTLRLHMLLKSWTVEYLVPVG